MLAIRVQYRNTGEVLWFCCCFGVWSIPYRRGESGGEIMHVVKVAKIRIGNAFCECMYASRRGTHLNI